MSVVIDKEQLVVIVDLDEFGYCALVEYADSEPTELTRRFGSWTTIPDDRGSFRDIRFEVSSLLEAEVVKFNKVNDAV